MTMEKYDVVVIGAGIGGLCAASYLAKAGKRVLILEHYVVPGGYAHEFTRGYYSFDVSLRAVDGVSPGSFVYPILNELDLLNTIRFKRLDPIYTVQFPEHKLSVPADHFAYEAMLTHQFPQEAKGIRALINAMVHVFYDFRRFTLDREMGRIRLTELINEDYPALFDAINRTWKDFMDQYIHHPQLQTIFSVLWNYLSLPPHRLSAAIFILRWVSLHVFGAFYPEDGVMSMSWALARIVKDHGGQIQYRQTVKQIEIRDGRGVAIETEKGLHIQTDAIISNANPPDTMLKLVGRQYLPEDYVKQIESTKPSLSNLVIYLGLNHDLHAAGWKHHEFFICPSYDSEASYQAVLAGAFDKTDISITYYNLHYPSCAPKGGSVVSLYSLAPWDFAHQWGTHGDLTNYQHNEAYVQLKQQLVNTMLDRAEQYLPSVRSATLYQEVATPLTNMRFSLNPGGSFSGSELTVENTFSHRTSPITPIPNLFLTGAWVSAFGISPVLLAGREAATLTKNYLAEQQ